MSKPIAHIARWCLMPAMLLFGCQYSDAVTENQTAAQPNYQLVMASEVDWQQLNPARGDASPKAATLWGNRNGTSATGFLFNPVDGFESPPHIHNVSYRGVVIRGLVHNDDPDAAKLWMQAGSFWTQPAGESHITAARGEDTLAYIEIDSGPYLVKPVAQAFDNGERPINVEQSNLVWLDGGELEWVRLAASLPATVQVSYLWGRGQADEMRGILLKMPSNFSAELKVTGDEFRAVSIAGEAWYSNPDEPTLTPLQLGSYFSSQGNASHRLTTPSKQSATLYIRTDGDFLLHQLAD